MRCLPRGNEPQRPWLGAYVLYSVHDWMSSFLNDALEQPYRSCITTDIGHHAASIISDLAGCFRHSIKAFDDFLLVFSSSIRRERAVAVHCTYRLALRKQANGYLSI